MKTSKFLLRGFRTPREVATKALGPLEQRVLKETWGRGEVRVRDIFVSFEKRVAYTTLMTTLDRLFKKRLMDRRKQGRAFFYKATVTAEELESGIQEDLIDGLIGGTRVEPILACIVDAVSERRA